MVATGNYLMNGFQLTLNDFSILLKNHLIYNNDDDFAENRIKYDDNEFLRGFYDTGLEGNISKIDLVMTPHNAKGKCYGPEEYFLGYCNYAENRKRGDKDFSEENILNKKICELFPRNKDINDKVKNLKMHELLGYTPKLQKVAIPNDCSCCS